MTLDQVLADAVADALIAILEDGQLVDLQPLIDQLDLIRLAIFRSA